MQTQGYLTATHLIFDALLSTVQLAVSVLSNFTYGGEIFSFIIAAGGGGDGVGGQTEFDNGTFTVDISIGQASNVHHVIQKTFYSWLGVAREVPGNLYKLSTRAHRRLHGLLESNRLPLRLQRAIPRNGNTTHDIVQYYNANGGYKAWLKDYQAAYRWASKQRGGGAATQILKKVDGQSIFDKAVQSLINSGALQGVTWP
jgi:hypothetical protein